MSLTSVKEVEKFVYCRGQCILLKDHFLFSENIQFVQVVLILTYFPVFTRINYLFFAIIITTERFLRISL